MMQDPGPSSTERLGRIIGGKWTLKRLLGSGGMAAVYAAQDETGATAAVKILHPEMSLNAEVRERFFREAYAANRVGHPGAVSVLDHGREDGGVAYLVMELLDGEPLSLAAARSRNLRLEQLLDYTDQILDVLAAAHDKGIIHRDLKPDNLFVAREGRVKVLDFGVARMLVDAPGEFRTRTGTAIGTLPYMAPEQARGKTRELDGRADLFSLGATLFRILSGRRIHQVEGDAALLMAMASKPAPPLTSVAPDVPPEVCAIVDLALAFSREARYPDARTMQLDVQAARAKLPLPYAFGRNVIAAREQSTVIEAGMPAPQPLLVSEGPAATMPVAGTATQPAIREPTTATIPDSVSPIAAIPSSEAAVVAQAQAMDAATGNVEPSEAATQRRRRLQLGLGFALLAAVLAIGVVAGARAFTASPRAASSAPISLPESSSRDQPPPENPPTTEAYRSPAVSPIAARTAEIRQSQAGQAAPPAAASPPPSVTNRSEMATPQQAPAAKQVGSSTTGKAKGKSKGKGRGKAPTKGRSKGKGHAR